MSMVRFSLLFPELDREETRAVHVFESLPADHPRFLPVDEYGFLELYCGERGCDCRRVMLNVYSGHPVTHLATINHAFEPPGKDDLMTEQTFLDPLNRQSPLAPALLRTFQELLLPDEAYQQRLIRHYEMFKTVVDDPVHPRHRLLHGLPPIAESARRAPIPPPPRRGKRKWK